MDERSVRVVRSAELSQSKGQTEGMTREVAIEREGVWIGIVRTRPRTLSGWHHHGENDTFAYVLRGRHRLEFGPNGLRSVEVGPGDFIHTPPRIVHREGTVDDEESLVVAFRVGTGPTLFNLEGPDPGA